ncbi:MAG: hypothetical protein ACJAWV_001887 [Flammeovirgaceae bacterium]
MVVEKKLLAPNSPAKSCPEHRLQEEKGFSAHFIGMAKAIARLPMRLMTMTIRI